MRYVEIMSETVLAEAKVPLISKQDAIDRQMFGPVYHGTNATARERIGQEGFKIARSAADRANGYAASAYQFGGNVPPPIHHLGNGIYFSTSKTIAKQFNHNSVRGLVEYYLDVPRLETINFGAPNTMMRWWVQNGYDYIEQMKMVPDMALARLRATEHLTESLSARADAVWFKGKGIRGRLLDGDQVCVYDPSRIYQIGHHLASGWDIGAVVTHNQRIHYAPEFMAKHHLTVERQDNGWTYIMRQWEDGRKIPLTKIPPPGMKGAITAKRERRRDIRDDTIDPRLRNQAQDWIDVKWQRGGIMHNYIEAELDPVRPKD